MPRRPERTKPPYAGAAPDASSAVTSALAILATSSDMGNLWQGRGPAPVADRQGADPAPRRDTPLLTAWVDFLSPHFVGEGNIFLTGTYSDEYGIPHGLMLTRNAHKDVQRFVDSLCLQDHEWLNAVEEHRYRDILHNHLLIRGPFTTQQAEAIKSAWAETRGHAYLDCIHDSVGCVRYVTKYCLKSRAESVEWNLQ